MAAEKKFKYIRKGIDNKEIVINLPVHANPSTAKVNMDTEKDTSL